MAEFVGEESVEFWFVDGITAYLEGVSAGECSRAFGVVHDLYIAEGLEELTRKELGDVVKCFFRYSQDGGVGRDGAFFTLCGGWCVDADLGMVGSL